MDEGPDIEIDLGDPEWDEIERPPAQSWLRRRHHGWYLLAALVCVLVLVGVGLANKSSHHVAVPTPPAPSTRATTPVLTPTPSPTPSPTPTSSAITTIAGPQLLDVPAGWQIFGRTDNSVVQIGLKSGLITITKFGDQPGPDPDSFVVGPDRAIIEPLNPGTGYVVMDGQPAQILPTTEIPGGPVLPGPDSGHIWVPSTDRNSMVLTDLNGKPTGPTLAVQSTSAAADGQGYVVYYDTGGVYDARPSGINRVTTGQILAIGATKWLTAECDDHDHCSTVVTDRSSGAKRTIGGSLDSVTSSGVISPDGSTAALLLGTQDEPALELLDLKTGALLKTIILPSGNGFGDGTFVWSPDSKWLFALDVNGALDAVDRTGSITPVARTSLPPLSQLALRSS